MPPKKKALVQKGNTNAKKARAEPDGPGDDPAVRYDGAAAHARAHCDHRRLASRLRLRLHRALRPFLMHCSTRATRRGKTGHRARLARCICPAQLHCPTRCDLFAPDANSEEGSTRF